jgi:hypothetical protein
VFTVTPLVPHSSTCLPYVVILLASTNLQRWRCYIPWKYWDVLNYLLHSVKSYKTSIFNVSVVATSDMARWHWVAWRWYSHTKRCSDKYEILIVMVWHIVWKTRRGCIGLFLMVSGFL